MEQQNNPLITANIVYYNNGDYIFEAIDSVLSQDYPEIELIISDDCSASFPEERIRNYVESNKRDNIKRVVIRRNEKNEGTVRHLELVREEGRREIDLTLAADDAWEDSKVFSSFVRKFSEDPKAVCVTAQAVMCNERLEPLGEYFVSDETAKLIQEKKWDELYCAEVSEFNPPGLGAAYRRSLFPIIGKLSDDYSIIEDFPTHLRILQNGLVTLWLNRVCIRHRMGGVSHGNKSRDMVVYRKYLNDMETLFQKEMLPYQERLTFESTSSAEKIYQYYHEQKIAIESGKTVRNNTIVGSKISGILRSHLSSSQIESIKSKFNKYNVLISIKLDLILCLLCFWISFSAADLSHRSLSVFALVFCICFGVVVITKLLIMIIFLCPKLKKALHKISDRNQKST